MNKIKFTKMHGCGNDYIYINCLNTEIKNPANLALQASKKHFGICADGLVLIKKPTIELADFKMEMYNNDGSRAQMCGNATRCVAKFLYDKKISTKETIQLQTDAGIKELQIQTKDNQVNLVTVNLGSPSFIAKDLPTTLTDKQMINHQINIDGSNFNLNLVSIGNPHAVIIVDKITDDHIHKLGPVIENLDIFPERINVEFIEIIDKDLINMRVWERGTGETLACGTGAAACIAVTTKLNLTNNKIKVNLLGGCLTLELLEDNSIIKSGPAEFVFDGEYYYNGE